MALTARARWRDRLLPGRLRQLALPCTSIVVSGCGVRKPASDCEAGGFAGLHRVCVPKRALETDVPVDDLLIGLSKARVYVQAKRRLRFGRPLDGVAEQWLHAIRMTTLMSSTTSWSPALWRHLGAA